ncbi:MAG TPA: cytochrome c [Kiloniellales bacterium]
MTAGTLSAQYELVKVVTDRQSLMFDMQAAYWVLLDVKNDNSTDLAAAADAAQTMNDTIDAFAELLLPGTAQGEVPGSRAKPEVWTEAAEFGLAAETFKAATAGLSDTAKSGDLDAFKVQFEVMAQACTGCHDFRPSRGGRFRHER